MPMKFRNLLLASSLLAVAAGAARAAPVTVPPGLNAGDQYRLAFVTDGRHDGTSNDIAVYNTFVTTEANLSAELAALNTT